MQLYTYTTIILLNVAILVWTMQRGLKIIFFSSVEKQTLFNLSGAFVISAWLLGYGVMTESFFIKEVATAALVCSGLTLAVNYSRMRTNRLEAEAESRLEAGYYPWPNKVLEVDFYRETRSAVKSRRR